MLGDSRVPANGRQIPLSGAICVPSADRVKPGLGRKKAVISCAFDSSIFNLSASRVGLFCSNRTRTFSQVQGSCAWTARHNVSGRNTAQPTYLLTIRCLPLPAHSDRWADQGKRFAVEEWLA